MTWKDPTQMECNELIEYAKYLNECVEDVARNI